jgi:hypothetical protein
MKFYRVHARIDNGSSAGFEFFRTKKEALVKMRELTIPGDIDTPELEEITVTPTKAGILRILNNLADHADNG